MKILAVSAGALLAVYLFLLNFGWFRGKLFTPESAPPAVKAPVRDIRCAVTMCSLIKTARPENPRYRFGFGEKICAFAELSQLPEGPHRVSFLWLTPEGGVQERYIKEFTTGNGRYRCWSWIELEGESFAISLGPIGSGKFIGEWTVKVYCDGFFLTAENFTVR